jgi:hypothetical protein
MLEVQEAMTQAMPSAWLSGHRDRLKQGVSPVPPTQQSTNSWGCRALIIWHLTATHAEMITNSQCSRAHASHAGFIVTAYDSLEGDFEGEHPSLNARGDLILGIQHHNSE